MIQLTTAAHCLAMLRSRNAIKDELRKHGLKLSHYTRAEVTSWAILYLEDNRATLLPDAIAEARRMILSGALGKRAARALAQAQDVHKTPKIEQSRIERSQSNGEFIPARERPSHC
jgi:hypothetical protein